MAAPKSSLPDPSALPDPMPTRTAPGLRGWLARLKPQLRWVVLGLTFGFIAVTLKHHWQGVMALRLRPWGLAWLGAALGVTLVAHIWSGAVWGLLLRQLLAGDRPSPSLAPPRGWAIATYLRTNLAKYLPGNIWHFYGRLLACRQQQLPLQPALLSILLEPLLMAAAALFLACLCYRFSPWQDLILLAILLGIHPRLLNPLVQRLARSKLQSLMRRGLQKSLQGPVSGEDAPLGTASTARLAPNLHRYPLLPLLGELLFVALRGAGFWLAVQALTSSPGAMLPILISAFSIAWVLGLVVPGAPGGIGVFEATAIALLQGQLSPDMILGAVACYRLVSTLAEVVGAAIGPLWHPLPGGGAS